MPSRSILLATLLLPALALQGLEAQALQGRLVAAGSDSAVAGAVLLQLGQRGETLAVATSDSNGHFEFSAGVPAQASVQVLRVGYAPFDLTPPTADARSTKLRFDLPMDRIVLPPIESDGKFACGPDPWSDGRLSALWEQGRTALLQVDATLRSDRYEYDATIWASEPPGSYLMPPTEMDTVGRPVILTGWPLPVVAPDSAMVSGFVLNPNNVWSPAVWLAPGPDFLLSKEFRDRFCFRVVTSGLTPLLEWHFPGAQDGWVGVEFRPDGSKGPSMIHGILWFDPASAELRTIEWRYVNLPAWGRPPRGDIGGGWLEIAQFSNGVRFAGRWKLRVPVPWNPGGTVRQVTKIYRELALWQGEVTGLRDISPIETSQIKRLGQP